MPTVESQLVDENIVYCDGDDVFTYIRNKKYADLPADPSSASGGTLTQAQVDSLIAKYSERADTFTKNAWRTRKAVAVELPVNFSHKQKHARHRRRRIRGTRGRHNFQVDPRAMVDFPHAHIKPIDSAKGDKIEILNPSQVDDVTGNEGRENGTWVIDERKGIFRPAVRLFTPVGTNTHGPTIDENAVKVRVTYRYGFPHDTTSYDSDSNGVSDAVPEDVRHAVAKWVASDLIGSDQYGEMVPSGGEGTPSLADAASRMQKEAKNELRDYKRV